MPRPALPDVERARTRPARSRRLLAALLTVLLTAAAWLTGVGATHAASTAGATVLCRTYAGCVTKGYSNFGYAAANTSMYWRMFSGHNCTNYVAYRLIQDGMSTTRPWTGDGNAGNWGLAMADITDKAPAVGSIAWWGYGVQSAASVGHVGYVQEVISPTEIIVSEDSYSGTFTWRRLVKGNSTWPTGFIHFDTDPARSAIPSFSDVAEDTDEADAISWMASSGVSTGWVEADGSRTYRPALPVGRDQMAAFMYRMAGSPRFTAPKTSPFADLTPKSTFYKEITWLRSTGVTTGWREADGSWTFRPAQVTNRDMMAAFMYRYAGKPKTGSGTAGLPADVSPQAPFAAEMAWSIATGVSKAADDGSYRPYAAVDRAMMAAFMYNYARSI